MRVDWRRRSFELALRLADALRGRAYKLPASLLLPPGAPAVFPGALASEPVKAAAAALSAVKLAAFLSSDRHFPLPTTESPELSVLLVTFNRAVTDWERSNRFYARQRKKFRRSRSRCAGGHATTPRCFSNMPSVTYCGTGDSSNDGSPE